MTNRLSRRGLAGLAALPAALFVGSAQAQSTTESAFDRVTRTKVLRVAAFPGALPYFTKDISTGQWAGACVEMANDLAKVFDAKVEFVESGYGPAVLDLQTNKIDLAFALNPTPARALSITFTKPMMIHPFGAILKPGMEAKTWADINKPDVRIVVDRGSAHDVAAHRFAPKAQIIVVDKPDEAVLTMLSGRADVNILAAMLALSTLGKNPALGHFVLLGSPLFALPSCIGLRREADTRLKEVVDAWLDMSRGTGQVREWLIAGIEMTGAKRADIPGDLSF